MSISGYIDRHGGGTGATVVKGTGGATIYANAKSGIATPHIIDGEQHTDLIAGIARPVFFGAETE